MSRTRPGQHSGHKAPADVRAILRSEGWATHDQSVEGLASGRLSQAARLAARTLAMTRSDVVAAQYPTAFVPDALLDRLRQRRIAVVHDLPSLREGRDVTEEVARLCRFDAVVVHTPAMAGLVADHAPAGGAPEIVVLEMFDYLVERSRPLGDPSRRPSQVCFAGNLSREKSPFAYGLDNISLSLYGVNIDTSAELGDKTFHRGVVDQADPVFPRDSFGLVWDGISAHSLTGLFGEYLRFNAPHKLSFYVAGGIPVIVPREAAVAPYVRRRGIGLVVDSLLDLEAVVGDCGADEWARMCEAVAVVRGELHTGAHTRRALLAAAAASPA